jgi:AhpD family alkylhydroperoxidase
LVNKKQDSGSPKVVEAEEEPKAAATSGSSCCQPVAQAECCASPPDVSTVADIAKIKEKFSAFMGAVNSDGAISLRNKELISIALSVVCKCEPCVKIHVDKARSLGIGQAEIDEAVWMGIAFGGAPVMMFYNTIMGKK